MSKYFLWINSCNSLKKDFPGGSAGKESAGNAGDPGLIPGSGRSPRESNGNPLQYSCLGNSIERGTWGCRDSDITERITLSLSILLKKRKWRPLESIVFARWYWFRKQSTLDQWNLLMERFSKITKEPLEESERGEWKSWLKAQHSENKDHGIQFHHFMANRWRNNANSGRLYFFGLQNHCRWWLQPWNKKTLTPWKKRYDQPRQHIKKQRQINK